MRRRSVGLKACLGFVLVLPLIALVMVNSSNGEQQKQSAEFKQSLIPEMAMSDEERTEAVRKKGNGHAEKPKEEAVASEEAEVSSPPAVALTPSTAPAEPAPPPAEPPGEEVIAAPPAPAVPEEPAATAEMEEEAASSAFVPPTVVGQEIAPETAEAELLKQAVFEQTVTLSFKNADLQNVLRIISRKTGLNIIMSEKDVKGTVTVHLEDVPLGAALESILKTNGLSFVLEPGNIVRVVPRKEVRKKEIELKTVHRPVNWVPAGRVKETLTPFLTEDGQIQADNDSNSLIITDTPPNVAILEDLVGKLDLPEKQVMIEARMVDMSEAARKELGISWGLLKYEPERPGWADMEQVTDIIFDPTLPRPGQLSIGKLAHFFGETWALDLTLSAMENRNEVVVLANPKVITLNNVPASIDITEFIPYTEAVQGPSGDYITEEVEFEESGIKMTVTPNITNNGYIRMKIEPEQKIFRGYIRVGLKQDVPRVDARKSVTNVIVKDEDTVVVGGLRKLERSNDTTGVPWFHRIPLFGWLFKDQISSAAKLELIIFVTPHIIKEPAITSEEAYRYDQIDYDWELPDYFYDEVKITK